MLDFEAGELLLFNKPLYWTSFDLVKKVRFEIQKALNKKKIKVGHAGTLDPLATGLMIICTGNATKSIEQYQNLSKEYLATIKFGATTPSFDLETEIDQQYEYQHITMELLKKCLEKFIGTLKQNPPVYSAKFINGKRAYEFARKGEQVKLKANEIVIHNIDLLRFELPVIELKIVCSKGTYIRSLARDIGEEMNSGAHLIELQRTAIGNYKQNDSLSFNDFKNLIDFL